MQITIELPEEKVRAIEAKARSQGISPEEYAREVLARSVEPGTEAEPFWKKFTERMHALPDEVFEKLPTDGAAEHDHYIHGSPKRNT